MVGKPQKFYNHVHITTDAQSVQIAMHLVAIIVSVRVRYNTIMSMIVADLARHVHIEVEKTYPKCLEAGSVVASIITMS